MALLLIVLVGLVAEPGTVWQLLRSGDPGLLAWAATGAAITVVLRGLRLLLLLPAGHLGLATATLVAAAAQAVALFVPARAGELALPWLLRRSAGWDLAAGMATLLAARLLDLAALGLWAGASVVALWGFERPLALVAAIGLLVPCLLLPLTIAGADWLALHLLAPRGRRGRRWTRRVRRLRRAIDDVRQRPARLLAAATVSGLMWAGVWGFTWLLLLAMGYRWPLLHVVAGSAAASLANLVPVNLVANLGTLEAGWTAAFTTLGVPVRQAAASGFAAHLWALAFAAVFGAGAWLVLLKRSKTRHEPQKSATLPE